MIDIRALNVELGEFKLNCIDLHVREGEFFVLLGPTGAGKTVLLEALAGLIPIRGGEVKIGGRDVTRLAPEKRGVGIVYQDNTLFPHLSVRENITYGLRYRRQTKEAAGRRLEMLIEQLDLAPLLARSPLNLSGGEIQRTTLARALATDPEILFLDEPLSALDPMFRKDIQGLLARLNRSSKVTFFMVTHDFSEALSLADRAAVINNGRIVQVDSVQNIFRRPATSFVAGFVGMKNIFAVEYRGTAAVIAGKLSIETGRSHNRSRGYIAVRPEDIVISRTPLTSSMRNSLAATVTDVFDQGFFTDVELDIGGTAFSALITKGSLVELDIRPGVRVYASFKATALHNL